MVTTVWIRQLINRDYQYLFQIVLSSLILPPECIVVDTGAPNILSNLSYYYCGPFYYMHTGVDECILNTDNCHIQATCRDIPGSFTCVCNDGYVGDGVTCAGKVCKLKPHPVKCTTPHLSSNESDCF